MRWAHKDELKTYKKIKAVDFRESSVSVGAGNVHTSIDNRLYRAEEDCIIVGFYFFVGIPTLPEEDAAFEGDVVLHRYPMGAWDDQHIPRSIPFYSWPWHYHGKFETSGQTREFFEYPGVVYFDPPIFLEEEEELYLTWQFANYSSGAITTGIRVALLIAEK